ATPTRGRRAKRSRALPRGPQGARHRRQAVRRREHHSRIAGEARLAQADPQSRARRARRRGDRRPRHQSRRRAPAGRAAERRQSAKGAACALAADETAASDPRRADARHRRRRACRGASADRRAARRRHGAARCVVRARGARALRRPRRRHARSSQGRRALRRADLRSAHHGRDRGARGRRCGCVTASRAPAMGGPSTCSSSFGRASLVSPEFLDLELRDGRLYGSLVDVLNRSAPTALLALGMCLVIATGGIDLSVGAVMAISGAICANLIAAGTGNVALIMLGGLAGGLRSGLMNASLVALLGLQPIIATLVLMVAGRGVAQLINDGQIVTFRHAGFQYLGTGSVLGVPTPVVIVLAAAVLLTLL